MDNRSVLITGTGCVCAAGADLSGTITSMFAGERHAGPTNRFETTHSVRYPVCTIPARWMPPELKESPRSLRCATLARHAARQAVEDAGLNDGVLTDARFGVSIGTTVGSEVNNPAFYRDYAAGRHPDMTPIKKYLDGDPAAVVGRDRGGTSLCQTVNNACASGTVAIGQAAGWIRNGLCDVAIAGGAEYLSRIAYDGFAALQVMDEQLCRPFDGNRDGLNLGEGAGIIILESADHARQRGAPIRGEIMGYGNSSDAYHPSGPRPDGAGLGRAIEQGLTESGAEADDISFINAHGTATLSNDRAEGTLYSEGFPAVPFLSTKGYTGHTLGAAGALEAVFTLAFLERGEVPCNAGFSESDPEFERNPVTEITAVQGNIAISSSVAFGGNNAVLVIGRGRP